MSTERVYSIKDAAALTGLPASTLRYYESVGLIPPFLAVKPVDTAVTLSLI